jgi:hypothetical protein
VLPDRILHLADGRNWSSIHRHGLLSTSALLDLLQVRGDERDRLERRHRPVPVTLHEDITITDQKPMPPHALRRCLPTGMTPAELVHVAQRQGVLLARPRSAEPPTAGRR